MQTDGCVRDGSEPCKPSAQWKGLGGGRLETGRSGEGRGARRRLHLLQICWVLSLGPDLGLEAAVSTARGSSNRNPSLETPVRLGLGELPENTLIITG
jgi:hypothetical protein